MANQYKNKIVYNGTVLLDLSTDTITLPEHIMAGFVGHLADGTQVTGTGQGGGTAAISVVDTEDLNGGTIRTITALDISDTTAVASDVAQGKYFYTAQGVKTAGTASGGGSTPSATAHTIYFEFSDNTNTTITAYWDSSFISDAITATTPTTYGGKTVTLAQLDGVAWYEPMNIPLNTQLVDYTKITADYSINSNGELVADQWYGATDYIVIDPSMTFSYKGNYWGSNAFYDSSKTFISYFIPYEEGMDTVSDNNNVGVGTLGGSGITIPSNAVYIRITTLASPDDTICSLIRTA